MCPIFKKGDNLQLHQLHRDAPAKGETQKQFNYRSAQVLRVSGASDYQISRQSAHEGGKVVSPKHRSLLPSRKYSWYSCLL